MENKVYVGIDLGTTNTLVAYKGKKGITILKFLHTGQVLPSVLFMDPETREIQVGGDAVKNGNFQPENRIRSAKTYIGRDKVYDLPVSGDKHVRMTPTDVAAEVLKAAKDQIIKKLKLDEDAEICAVITVPAAFSGIQKDETKKAAEQAGITCLGLRPEPVAAAIAGAEDISPNSMVFVVDIGGGTYDTAVVAFDDNLEPNIVSQEGDRELGGDDFDREIYNYLLDQVGEYLERDLSDEFVSGLSRDKYLEYTADIHDRAIEVKQYLSSSNACNAVFNSFSIEGYNNDEPVPISIKVTRDKFNSLCADIYKRIEDRLDKSIAAFKRTGHTMDDITHLVLVGGSCYIPAVIELCEKKLGIRSSMKCDKTTAVAEGAGFLADSWVTVGAKIGGLVAQSMGIKVAGEKFSKIIGKNTYYPCRGEDIFTTVYDNQASVDVAIYYASPDKEDCVDINEHEYYGYFTLDNIQQAKAGVPRIKVLFDFDSSEQLTVTATDEVTGSTRELKLQRSAMSEKPAQHSKPMAIDLLIDCSYSMNGEPMADAKNACRRMIFEIVDFSVNEVGITSFYHQTKSICEITSDKSKLMNSIDEMQATGSTIMSKGIDHSCKKLLQSDKPDKIIFMMTDGVPDIGDLPEVSAKNIRHANNVRLAVIYIGQKGSKGYSVAQNVAKANALSGETPLFYTSKSMSELGKIFKRVYTDIINAN